MVQHARYTSNTYVKLQTSLLARLNRLILGLAGSGDNDVEKAEGNDDGGGNDVSSCV